MYLGSSSFTNQNTAKPFMVGVPFFYYERAVKLGYYTKDKPKGSRCLKIAEKLRVKRATFTFWMDTSKLKLPKMVHFGDFLTIWSLRSKSVTRQVTFNRTKIGGKRQKKINCDILSNFQTMWGYRSGGPSKSSSFMVDTIAHKRREKSLWQKIRKKSSHDPSLLWGTIYRKQR